MKKTSRSQSFSRYFVPIIAFMMSLLIVSAIWNASVFDLIWIIGTFVVASFVTATVIAPRLLPIEDNAEERVRANAVFWRFFFGRGLFIALIRDGRVQAESKPPNIDVKPVPGFIIADSTSVVALRTGTGISRVEGAHLDGHGRAHSGVIFTNPEEEIDTIVDLRPQVRRQSATAQTRDGITVQSTVIAIFAPQNTRARKMDELHELKHQQYPRVNYPPPFAWRRSSILQVLSTRHIERAGDKIKKTEWYDRIMEIAIPRLRDLISDYTVDELTAWNTADKFPVHPRYVIRGHLFKDVKQELDANDELRHPTGIDVRVMVVAPPMPPDEVIQRRIQAWVEEWRKKESDIFAQADAEAIRLSALVRAQVHGEMTTRINDILKEVSDPDTARNDVIRLRLLEVMEQAHDPATRALLTIDAPKILKQLLDLFTPDQKTD